ncbi:hypothetical protein O3M35_007476 [Rhynocoris fuscipes]|uniref:Cytoplasmic dynein 2 light intermediate chain 1 n=1 Tax=Rhynocoris fuscipes TaxID=488301 RepID=A0AAW1DD65_9HEMI
MAKNEDDVDLYCARLTAPLVDTVLEEVIAKAEKFLETRIESEEIQENSLFIIGSKSSGKTTFAVDVFELTDEEVRQTLTLEYFCAIKFAEDRITQKLTNIWELAGGTIYGSVLNTIKEPTKLSAAIFLDLSSPTTLWHTAVSSLEIYRKYIETRCKGIKEQKVSESIKDKNWIKPFPIPLYIIGGKYDLFQELDPEPKRVICQFLRYLAHSNYAFLFFYSNKLTSVARTAKEIVNHKFFGALKTYKAQYDYNKPLLVPAGEDSFESIEGKKNLDEIPSIQKYKEQLQSYFNQDEGCGMKYRENPRYNTNYKEPKIDYMRNEKDDVLDKLLREKEMEISLKLNKKNKKETTVAKGTE